MVHATFVEMPVKIAIDPWVEQDLPPPYEPSVSSFLPPAPHYSTRQCFLCSLLGLTVVVSAFVGVFVLGHF